MQVIGRTLTDEGMENVMKLDTNQDGKLDANEVNLRVDYNVDVDDNLLNIDRATDQIGQDYGNIYFNFGGSCILCRLTSCSGRFSCVKWWWNGWWN